MINKVVVHYAKGKIVKGETTDFFPNKNEFHLKKLDSNEILPIDVQTLKAIYFVESFEGDSTMNENIGVERTGFGKKIRIQFRDGEVQYGYTQGYSPERPGFFVTPCDPNSNNLRIFVVTRATALVRFAEAPKF